MSSTVHCTSKLFCVKVWFPPAHTSLTDWTGRGPKVVLISALWCNWGSEKYILRTRKRRRWCLFVSEWDWKEGWEGKGWWGESRDGFDPFNSILRCLEAFGESILIPHKRQKLCFHKIIKDEFYSRHSLLKLDSFGLGGGVKIVFLFCLGPTNGDRTSGDL